MTSDPSAPPSPGGPITERPPLAARALASLGWSRPLGRRVLAYCAAGPLGALLLAAIVRGSNVSVLPLVIGLQLFFALVLVALIRPGSFERSMWRALFGTLWLAGPLVLFAATSIPAEAVMLSERHAWGAILQRSSLELWTTLWLGVGFAGCLFASIALAIPRAQRGADGADGAAPSLSWQYVRLGVVMTTLAGVLLFATFSWSMLSLLVAIPRSHVNGNVPGAEQFDVLLQRDLLAYFEGRDSTEVSVDYQLLRRQPTQTGIAFPKYYAWARVRTAGGQVGEGVVRLAAMDRTRFEVTEYLSREEILADPSRVESLFPPALKPEILKRARSSSH